MKELGDSAFDTAEKYGKTAEDYLAGVLKMYQAGQQNAAQMAELSLLAQTAGGMDDSTADGYLIAGNAAYDLKGNAKELSKILDGQNAIAENTSATMLDMAQATAQAASAASRSGVEIKELSSLIALDGLPADDNLRTDILSGIGGTENADVLSAILDNWSSFEELLRLYDSGMGSAVQTAEQYAGNWEGSLNRLSNTWQDTVHNILSSDVMTAITNQLNGFLSIINKITDKLGSLGSIGVGAGLFAGLKNVGRDKMDSPTLLF